MRRTMAVITTVTLVILLTSQAASADILLSERGSGMSTADAGHYIGDIANCECDTYDYSIYTSHENEDQTVFRSSASQGEGQDDTPGVNNSQLRDVESLHPPVSSVSRISSFTHGEYRLPPRGLARTASVDLQVEAGIPDHSDSTGVSLSFQYTGDSPERITAELTDEPYGNDVTYTFVGWSSPSNGTSGRSSSWTAYPGETYVVNYRVEATNEAAEQLYTASVQVSGRSGTYLDEDIRADVDVLEPVFSSASGNSGSVTLTPEGNTFSEEFSFEFGNSGDGRMRIESVTADSRDPSLQAQVTNRPTELEANDAGTVSLQLSGDKDINEGTYMIDVTVEDAVGTSVTYTVEVEILKPPAVNVPGGRIDVGDVVRSQTTSKTITLEEITGFDNIQGVTVNTVISPTNATLDIQDLSSIRISAGGSTDTEATIQVDDVAPIHEQLYWRLRVSPENEPNAETQTAIVTGRVIIEQQFGEIDGNDLNFTYDQPRPATYEQSIRGVVRNRGHFELDVTDVTASVDQNGISADVVQSPDSISRHGADTYEVVVRAEDTVPEGEYTVEITFEAADAESKTVTRTVSINHQTEMRLSSDTVEFGEITLTETDTRTVTVEEVLGYQNIENLNVDVSGPDEGWLSTDSQGSVSAGSSEMISFTVNFDDRAEVFEEYTWTIEISGDSVETKTVILTATYGFPEDEVIEELNSHAESGGERGDVASSMITVLEGLEEKAQNDEISGREVSLAFTAGRAADQFLDAMQRYQETVEGEGESAAQDELLEAAVAFNTFERYATQLSDEELRENSDRSLGEARALLDGAITNQETYYEEELQAEDTSLLEAANVKRELARIALFRGNSSRARDLQTEANRTYDLYTENVSSGVEHLQNGDRTYREMQSTMLIVIVGQPILPNPMAYDDFQRQSQTVLEEYDQAEANFRAAGATEQADAVRDRRNEVASEFTIARYSLYVLSALYLLVFLYGIIRMSGNMIAYTRDVREAASGDFLV